MGTTVYGRLVQLFSQGTASYSGNLTSTYTPVHGLNSHWGVERKAGPPVVGKMSTCMGLVTL